MTTSETRLHSNDETEDRIPYPRSCGHEAEQSESTGESVKLTSVCCFSGVKDRTSIILWAGGIKASLLYTMYHRVKKIMLSNFHCSCYAVVMVVTGSQDTDKTRLIEDRRRLTGHFWWLHVNPMNAIEIRTWCRVSISDMKLYSICTMIIFIMWHM